MPLSQRPVVRPPITMCLISRHVHGRSGRVHPVLTIVAQHVVLDRDIDRGIAGIAGFAVTEEAQARATVILELAVYDGETIVLAIDLETMALKSIDRPEM